MRVVLPAPFCPIRAIRSPGLTRRSSRSSTCWRWKFLLTCYSCIMNATFMVSSLFHSLRKARSGLILSIFLLPVFLVFQVLFIEFRDFEGQVGL